VAAMCKTPITSKNDVYYEKIQTDADAGSSSLARDLIAGILLDAVEESFVGDKESRRWLARKSAKTSFDALGIDHKVALDHLRRKWAEIDKKKMH